MLTLSKRSLSIALLVAVLNFGVSAHDGYTPVAWNDYHWIPDFTSGQAPITLEVRGTFTGSTYDLGALNDRLTEWELSTPSATLDLTAVPGSGNAKRCRPTQGKVEVCSASYSGGWLGQAQVWVSGVHINQATVKLNERYLSESSGYPIYQTADYRQMVLCHELGHAVAGLGHPNVDFYDANLGTCMDYTLYPLMSQNPLGGLDDNILPHQHDGEHVTHYATVFHSGETTSEPPSDDDSGGEPCRGRGKKKCGNLPPPAMGQIDFETPGQWGRLVSSSANGRGQVYELDFGGGHRVITYVLWADPVTP